MGEIRLDYSCRLCLKEGFSLTNIFTHRSAAGDPLYRILNFIYEMKIFENDGLPSQICSPCMWRMTEFDTCKRNVRSAEAEIMRLLNQTRPRSDEAQNNSLVIKTEDTEMDGTSEVGNECDTVHPENPEETYDDSLLTKAEVTEMDGASEVEIDCDTFHSEINVKEEIEIVEWQMPEEMIREEMDIEGQGNRNPMNIDHGSCSSKVISRGKDSELKESELFIGKLDVIQPTGSSDIANFMSLEASEENVGYSFDRGCVFSTQGISDKNADKGIPENDLRGDVAPGEESISAELSESILDVTKSEVVPLKPPLSKKKRMFICDICKMSLTTKQHLGNHVRVHSGERPFKCNICDKRFKQDSGRNQHELRHFRDNISFGNSEKESKKNKFNCGICTKNFSSKCGLLNHSNLHSKKFKCNSCGKCFPSNFHLRRHFRIHTKEKPFKCKVCSKCFYDKYHLNSHSRIHSSEKLFSCEICDKKFKRKVEKVLHELQHLRKNNILNC